MNHPTATGLTANPLQGVTMDASFLRGRGFNARNDQTPQPREECRGSQVSKASKSSPHPIAEALGT